MKSPLQIGLVLQVAWLALACSSSDVTKEDACMGCVGVTLDACHTTYDECMNRASCDTDEVKKAFADEECK